MERTAGPGTRKPRHPIHFLQAPESLAWLLEAAGAVARERCGAILDERTATAGE